MPIESAEDLAVFFDPEEHGEAIHYNGVSMSAIWHRPSGDLETPAGRFRVETNTFMLPVTAVAKPVGGDVILVDRLALGFTVAGTPALNGDGTIWTCEVIPA